MPEPPTPGVDPERDARSLLSTLTSDESHRPWSVDELAHELGADPVDALDVLARAGVIHRLHGFVWATRACLRARELNQER